MGTIFPKSSERVARSTSAAVNRRLQGEAEERIAFCARHPEEIDRRLEELDREWDIERVLQANASTLMLAGVTLGATADRRWLWLPTAVAGFLLQHALQGWCPPLPLLRRLGVRTVEEIAQERYALKALRGDFDAALADGDVEPLQQARRLLEATRRRVMAGGEARRPARRRSGEAAARAGR